jgi:hypothetical protein
MAEATTGAPAEGTTPAATPGTTTWAVNPSLTKFGGDAEKLAESYLELEKSFSGRVKIPGEQATDDERNAFHKALGRPDKSEDYKITLPAAPEGVTRDDSLLQKFLPVFHAAGLSNAQAERLAHAYAEHQMAEAATRQTQAGVMRQENLAELEKTWGADFKRQMALGDKALQQWGDDDLRDLFTDETVKTNPAFRKFLAKIGQLGLEGKYYEADAVATGMKSPQEIEKRIGEIRADPAFFNDFGPNAARHAALMKELALLTEQRRMPATR